MNSPVRITILGGLVALAAACAGSPVSTTPITKVVLAPDARWEKLNTAPYRGKQDDIYFVDAETGWYGNGAGKIYHTQDGGKNWLEQFSRAGTFVRALGFVNKERGFMGNIGTDYYPGVTDTSPLYETRDGGKTWTAIVSDRITGPTVKGLCAIDVLQKNSIFQGALKARVIVHAAGRVGGPAFLMRSLDGGERWKTLDLSAYAAAIMDVKFFDENVGFILTATDVDLARSNGAIAMTRDGGVTWKTVFRTKRPHEIMWKMSFPTREVGYATIQSYDPDKSASKRYIAKTVDGGLTWAELPLVDDYAVREFGIGFVDATTGWVGTSTSGFQTTDGGKSWVRVEMGRAVNKIRLLPTAEGQVGYAIGVDVFKLRGLSYRP